LGALLTQFCRAEGEFGARKTINLAAAPLVVQLGGTPAVLSDEAEGKNVTFRIVEGSGNLESSVVLSTSGGYALNSLIPTAVGAIVIEAVAVGYVGIRTSVLAMLGEGPVAGAFVGKWFTRDVPLDLMVKS
jgi:hypothetical protein